MEVLKGWLNTRPDPSWEGLVQALRRRVVEEETLAKELEMKYCPQQTVSPPGMNANTLLSRITTCLT